MICDEVSLGLAPIVVKGIYDALPKITSDGLAVIIVEQDIDTAMRVSDRVYCFMHGRVSLKGRSADLTKKNQISDAYFWHLGRLIMIEWIDTMVQGILTGGLYALFAIGLSLTYGVMRLVNIAHGDFIMLSAYIALVFVTSSGVHPFVALPIVVVVMFALGYFLQRTILNRTLGPDILPPLLVTFGMSIIIQNGLLEGFSADAKSLNVGDLATASLHLGENLAIGWFPFIAFSNRRRPYGWPDAFCSKKDLARHGFFERRRMIRKPHN
ncbi:hypothetical protein ACFS07_17445 [Undibacterium arcticum]